MVSTLVQGLVQGVRQRDTLLGQDRAVLLTFCEMIEHYCHGKTDCPFRTGTLIQACVGGPLNFIEF